MRWSLDHISKTFIEAITVLKIWRFPKNRNKRDNCRKCSSIDGSFCHQMINSLIQCHQFYYLKKHNFAFLFNTSVCTRQAITNTRTCISTNFLGHEQNMNSRTLFGAGFTLFHLMHRYFRLYNQALYPNMRLIGCSSGLKL